MEHNNITQIIGALAHATDPNTGEVFPPDSPYRNANILSALKVAYEVVKNQKPKIRAPLRLSKTRIDNEIIPMQCR